MISISLFYCSEWVLTHTNMWIIGKRLIKFCYLQKKIFKVIWNKKFRRLSCIICSKWYTIVSWCIWKLSKYVSWKIWAWSCSLSFRMRISMASSLKKQQSKIRPFNWYWYVINGRKMYQIWNMSRYLSMCES